MSNEQQSTGVRLLDVDEESVGQRLDNFLIRVLKGVPRSRIYRIIRKGEVRVNKGRVRPETRLQAGDRVRVPPIRTAAPRERISEHYEFIEKTIIYEDDVMLIINKPAGLAVHGGSGISLGLIEALRACRPDARHLELIHRLDRDTSGCLMIAKRRSYQRLVQAALRQRSAIDKVYLAIVHGRWPKRLTRVNAPLERDVLASGERVSRVRAEGKASVTDYQCLDYGGMLSLIEARPATGRTHQIRVHCQHAGFPVVGDRKYGESEADRRLAGRGYARMMLHARRLSVPALGDYPPVTVEAPVDESMTQLMEEIKSSKNK